MRLVQLHQSATRPRAVALVDEPHLRVIDDATSIAALALEAIGAGKLLSEVVAARANGPAVEYGPIHDGTSAWRLLPAIDHPGEPSRCLVSGTSLTHLGSAASRQRMHEVRESDLTDSMKMFRLGLERGKPAAGQIGAAPEWFYKGSGTTLRAHNEPLEVPAFAEDGGEEAEIAGVYVIDPDGRPHRVGMAMGNEFSDHVFERRNYLNLAGSKLRTCSLGPELVVAPPFQSVAGRVRIHRAGTALWSSPIATGEDEMCHSLRNIEHHHFKYTAHRRPGDVHVHYFGACALSCTDNVRLVDGDVMEVSFDGFGRPLRNPLRAAGARDQLVQVRPLD